MFASADNRNILFAECKWRNDLKDVSTLECLIEKASLFSGYNHKYYYLFSKVGFSPLCRELSLQMGNVVLIDLKALFA